MLRTRIHIFVIALILLSGTSLKSSEFSIDSWNLLVNVSSGFPNSSSHSFSQIQNPFSESHAVNLGNASSTASYDFTWNESAGLGRFLIESAIAAEGQPDDLLFSSAENRIRITPSSPITINVHAEYTFDLPVDHMRTRFELVALGLTSGTVAFSISKASIPPWDRGRTRLL